jgi:hypothetical protein
MIYFDEEKNAYGYVIENPICSIDDEIWANYAGTDKWDIVNGVFTDITDTEEYKEKKAAEEEAEFNKQFFKTALGYVRRQVTMKDGSKKDFLADILPLLVVGVPVLVYSRELEQTRVSATESFINECKQQLFKDFYGNED